MDDKNTETTTTTDSAVKAVDTTTTKASAPAADSKPVVKEPTPTTMGGGENTNMANITTKKVDPKFEGCQTYTVVKGDALVDIADKFGVGLNQLRYFNNVPKATFKISEGQTIYIPKGEVKVPVGA